MQILKTIVASAGCLIEILLCMYFFSTFKSLRIRKSFMYVIVLLCGCTYSMCLYYFHNGVKLFLASLIITQIIALCYDYKWNESILMTVIISVISGISELMITELQKALGVDYSQANSNMYVYMISLFAVKTITYIIIIIIRKGKHRTLKNISKARFIQLMLLPAATAAIAIVFSHYIISYNAPDAVKIGSISALLILIISNIMIFNVIDTQDELISTREKLKTSRLLMDSQRSYYDDIYRSQIEVRKTRHDLKNIFIAVLSELDAGNTDRTREIIKRKLSEIEQHVYIGGLYDNVIDAVIYEKSREAEAHGIRFIIQRSISQRIFIDDLDITVLIANLLDNAIEAAAEFKGEKYIDFSFITEKENLIIVLSNPTVNVIDKRTGLRTTKPDKANHGYGMISIESIIEKYNGYFNWSCTDGVFSVTIILPNRRSGI